MPDSSPVSMDVDISTDVVTQDAFVDLFAEGVRNRGRALGFNGKTLAEELQEPSSSVANYWSGKRPWPTAMLDKLAAALKTTPMGLFAGASGATMEGLDLVPVGEIDLAYGLGGTFADAPIEVETLHFPRSWLESITRTPAELLTFARGRGDSMQPTLQDGDMVLIDRSLRSVREQDALWALTVGDIAMIKRLRIRGEEVTILSDNANVPDDRAHPEEINIVGRIIFVGRRL